MTSLITRIASATARRLSRFGETNPISPTKRTQSLVRFEANLLRRANPRHAERTYQRLGPTSTYGKLGASPGCKHSLFSSNSQVSQITQHEVSQSHPRVHLPFPSGRTRARDGSARPGAGMPGLGSTDDRIAKEHPKSSQFGARAFSESASGRSDPPPGRPGAGCRGVPSESAPVFEGGGGVLLPPAFWERAGWGIAVLLATAASAGEIRVGCPPGSPSIVAMEWGFPRTSPTSRISLHLYGR